jgi:hypothetical protein
MKPLNAKACNEANVGHSDDASKTTALNSRKSILKRKTKEVEFQGCLHLVGAGSIVSSAQVFMFGAFVLSGVLQGQCFESPSPNSSVCLCTPTLFIYAL